MDTSPKWTKSYRLRAHRLSFLVLVSEHEGYFASCIWHEPGRLLKAPGQSGGAAFYAKTRFATTEQDALDQILEWAQLKFGKPFDLIEQPGPVGPEPSPSSD